MAKNDEGMTWAEWYGAVIQGPCCTPNAGGACNSGCPRLHMRFAADDLVKAWTDCVDPAEYQAKTNSAAEKTLEIAGNGRRTITVRRINLVKGTRQLLQDYLRCRGFGSLEDKTHTLRMAALDDYDGECVTSHTQDGPCITLLDWYAECLRADGKPPMSEDGVTGEDLAVYDIPLMGGCATCGATIAAYNACPTRRGYIACRGSDCSGDGFKSVDEYATWLVENKLMSV